MNKRLRSIVVNQKITWGLLILSAVLLVINLIGMDYDDIDILEIAKPVSNVMLIVFILIVMYLQKRKE